MLQSVRSLFTFSCSHSQECSSKELCFSGINLCRVWLSPLCDLWMPPSIQSFLSQYLCLFPSLRRLLFLLFLNLPLTCQSLCNPTAIQRLTFICPLFAALVIISSRVLLKSQFIIISSKQSLSISNFPTTFITIMEGQFIWKHINLD